MLERCCLCREKTPYWYTPNDVALCQDCAATATHESLPSKQEWCAKEEAIFKHPAEFTVHTPTGPVHSCVKHARQIQGLMRMLGAHTHAVKAPDGAECANCINEEKAKGEPS